MKTYKATFKRVYEMTEAEVNALVQGKGEFVKLSVKPTEQQRKKAFKSKVWNEFEFEMDLFSVKDFVGLTIEVIEENPLPKGTKVKFESTGRSIVTPRITHPED